MFFFAHLTPQKFAKAGGYPDHRRAHPEDGEIRPKDAARPLIREVSEGTQDTEQKNELEGDPAGPRIGRSNIARFRRNG
jgi:hypothetical protein